MILICLLIFAIFWVDDEESFRLWIADEIPGDILWNFDIED